MRVFIIFGFVTTLSAVLCREYHLHHRENVPLRRYRDTKNKRGIGDYPLGLTFGGQSFSGFQAPSSSAVSQLGGGFAGFGGFGGGSSLSLSPSPFGISLPSASFSSIGSSGLGGLGSNLGSLSSLTQPWSSLGQGSGLSFSGSSGVNLASLLGGQGNSAASYSSPSIGLFTPSDKNVPVNFGAQTATAGQAQQYTPVYATSTQLGSASYSSPSISNSQQGSGIQGYGQPSTLSLSSLLSGNGFTYSSPSSSPTSSSPDSASHAVTKNYVISSAPQTGGSSQSYSVPLSAVASSSSPTYSVAIPSSYTSAGSSNSAGSSPYSSYQLAIAPSTYSSSPLTSASNHYTKYIPISSDGSMYINKSPLSNYNAAIKLSGYASPSTSYESPSKTTLQQAVSPSQTVTSYGTPVIMYSIPSTSYGTPSQQASTSSAHYNPSSSGNASPSIGYAAASSYSSPSSMSSSSSHQSNSPQKGPVNNIGSPVASYGSSNSNYGSSSGSSAESNSVSGYKIQSPSSTATLSNSIENYSSAGQPSTHDSGTDSSSSYSNHAIRYIRYPVNRPSPYLDNDEEVSVGSSYDTISYSVPSGKY